MKTSTNESGSLTAELVILTPLIMMVVLLMVAFGRVEIAAGQVADAARGAAQAAVLWPTPGQASQAATVTGSFDLHSDGITCAPYGINVDTNQWGAGGNVSVTVTCQASLAGVALAGVPGSITLRSTVVAPIETYRSIQ